MTIKVVTDSNCDLPDALIREHGITVVPLYINVGTDSYLDGVEMSRAQFYEGLADFETHPTTSVPGPGAFVEAYERLAAEGATEILSVHISANLSAVANSARLAAEETEAARVTVFDSGNLTLGTGLQALAASRAATQGRSMAEIVDQLEDQASRTHCFAVLDTLEFLRRSGRLSRFQFMLGSVLQIRPILKMNEGNVDMERVRTRKGAMDRVLELVRELGPLDRLALVHTHAPERAEALRKRAVDLMPETGMPLSATVTPVIGAHIGPGAAGFVAIQSRQR
jgi:DegV family protein with EDD domain